MSKAIGLSKDMVGKKVRLIEQIEMVDIPIGTVGIITYFDEAFSMYVVKWKDIQGDDGECYVENYEIELVDKPENEKIWDMLLPTLERLGLEQTYIMGYGSEELYEGDVIHEVISEVYKLAYERGRQGKDFIIEE